MLGFRNYFGKIIKEKLLKNINTISDSKFQQESNYGFYNYNSLNFFNIQPSKEILDSEELSLDDIKLIHENTHSCCLVYSNRKIIYGMRMIRGTRA